MTFVNVGGMAPISTIEEPVPLHPTPTFYGNGSTLSATVGSHLHVAELANLVMAHLILSIVYNRHSVLVPGQ